MLIQDIIPPEKRNQVSCLPKPRQVKKASKKALPVLLIAFLIVQIIAGPFVPFNFSQNPPSISSQEAKAVVGTSIATCLELQNMNNNLTASYYLTNDIDCSDTTSLTWNDGQGFRPVGYYDEGWDKFPFTGSFDGQGYKITNLYMDWEEIDGVYVGGLFGYTNNATIENVGLENANITIQHTEWGGAGALVGSSEGNSTISNSYSTGSISSGNWETGGLVGYNSNSTISNSYSTSSVSGSLWAGGLVGNNSNGTISNSYSIGSVSGSTNVGGLVGLGSGTASNSFWDTETSGQATSERGTGKTTAEMKNVRTFTDVAWSAGLTVPWDFTGDPYDDVGIEDIWNIDDTGEKNNGYSFLSWQNTTPDTPILVSPADMSYTTDDTPTLSANYFDSDTGDTGTINYRIAASSANCLDGTVIASGTSAATSSNNATTTWTPSSSIGDDDTYYWCAQNNDGVVTSAWTAMGNFVLDTTGPVISLSSPANNSSTGDNTPTLTWSGSDATSGIAKYQLYIDSVLDTDNISNSATSTTPANELSCGSHTWYVRAYDNADNYTDSSVFNLTMACGSGLPPSASNPPALPESTPENPDNNFSVTILRQAQDDNSTIVTLKLNAGSDTKRMAISNTEDFKYASQVLYQKEISWDLSSGRDEAVPCLYNGEYTVYAKFYTQYGVASEVVSDSIILKTVITGTEIEETTSTETEKQQEDPNQEEPVSETGEDKDPESLNNSEPAKTNPSKSSSFTFTKNLKLGSYGTEVANLQNKLKELNFFPKETKSNSNFGLATKQAVIEYQRSKEIYPCGIVGPRTRKALNNEEFITNKDYKFTQDLKYNDKNEEVKQLQTRLRDQNFFPYYLQSTGWFGPTTQKAVNIFQKFYNLIQSGVVDEGMREVLDR